MSDPAKTIDQNILPVQALFNLDNTFNTFIGQGQPFYATLNPVQSGLTITNSTIDSTTIGATTPSTGVFTNISTTTGQISTTPSSNTDIANKFYVDTVAQGLGPKAACQVATTGNITLSGIQTIDGYTISAGDRVLVKNQSTSANNGIYIASSGAWSRSTDMDVWSEVPGAYTVILNGSANIDTGWVCTASTTGTIGTTPMPWVQFANVNTYTAGTGLTLASNQFSITNTGVTAGSYGSANQTLTANVNAQGQLTSLSASSIAISNSQVSGLGTLSTQNANSVAITGGSINGTTIGASTASTGVFTTLGGTTITASTQFTGSGAGLTGTAPSLSIGGNAATATYATSAGSATTSTTATNLAGGANGSLPYQTASGTTTFLGIGSTGQVLTVAGGVPTWSAFPSYVSSFSAGTTGFTPSSSTTGAITLSGTLNVANGGTGVTTSSGANSVVLRDSNQNVYANNFIPNTTTTNSSSTPINLTVASAQYQIVNGTTTSQVFNLPDATTLTVGDTFYFNNNITYSSVQINAHDGTTSILALQAGGAAHVILLTNGTTNGTWDVHSYIPSSVSWGNATLNFNNSSSISGSVSWLGNNVGLNNGGTNASLTATAGGVVYSTSSALAISAAGSTGQVLTSNGSSAPTWSTPTAYATVTDDTTTAATRYPLFANQTSGNLLTEYTSSTKLQYNPSTGVFTSTSFSGAGTGLTGTASSLSIGGNAATATSATSATSATTATNLAGGANGSVPYQTASGTTTFLAASTNGYVMTLSGGVPTWSAAASSGITISDDTSSVTAYYPLFARVTSGTATTEYTSSTKLTYQPSTGTLTASYLTPTNAVGIAYGGTGQTTANAAFNALAPSQTSNTGKYLKTDGTNTSWSTLPSSLLILLHSGSSTTSVSVANGVLPITNHSGSTINVAVT